MAGPAVASLATRTMGSLIEVLFPPTCLLCGAAGVGGRDLCAGCAAELPFNRSACPHCALPLDWPPAPEDRCGACLRQPPPFAAAFAALRYEGPVPYLVGGAKFRGQLNVARLLGQLLAEVACAQAGTLPQVLVPVPLHPSRLAQRGYNQSLEIARVVGSALKLPVAGAGCRRILATPPQAGLAEQARRRNIRGAFAAQTPFPWSHVALIDDVVTTGSTVGELAKVLQQAGVQRIEVWAVARTP